MFDFIKNCFRLANRQPDKQRRPRRRCRLLTAERLDSRRMLAAGAFDSTFHDNGILNMSFDPTSDVADIATEILERPGGGVIVVGSTENTEFGGDDMAIVAFQSDGTPDLSFDIDGRKAVNFTFDEDGTSSGDHAFSAAVQNDGKILVAGGSSGQGALLRLHPNGSLDTSFGSSGTGKVLLGPALRTIKDIAVDSEGRIVVIGDSHDYEAMMGRVTADGVLDTAFSGDGLTMLLNNHSHGSAVIIDGSSYVAAMTLNDVHMAILRIDTELVGEAPATLASVVPVASWAEGMDIQADGRIVVAGRVNDRFAVARLVPVGEAGFALDADFNADGIAVEDFGPSSRAASVVVEGDKILVAGWRTNSGLPGVGTDGVVLRYNADGTLDPSFAAGGMQSVQFQEPGQSYSGHSRVHSIALEQDGSILLAGIARLTGMNPAEASGNQLYDIGLARLQNDVGMFFSPTGLIGEQSSGDASQSIAAGTTRVVLGDDDRHSWSSSMATLSMGAERHTVHQPNLEAIDRAFAINTSPDGSDDDSPWSLVARPLMINEFPYLD